VPLSERLITYGLLDPVPWMRSDDFQTIAESVCEVCVRGKGRFPVAARWFWQVTNVLSDYTTKIYPSCSCDAVLRNSPQCDCRSSPCPPLLSPGFLTVSRTSCKHALEDHRFRFTVTSSRSVNQEASFCFTAEQLKRDCILSRYCCPTQGTSKLQNAQSR